MDRLDRRSFARLFALGGSAALVGPAVLDALARTPVPPLPRTPPLPNASFWKDVRAQFLMPSDLTVLNAANLCPSPASVLKAMYDNTQRLDRAPVPSFRNEMHDVKESTRRLLADYLHVTADEIVITRNTSEANNSCRAASI